MRERANESSVRVVQGTGALIKGHGAARRYGHVEVTLQPLESTATSCVDWSVAEDMIPRDQQPVILATARAYLERLRERAPHLAFRLTIINGYWLGDAANDLYDVATELAIEDAYRRLQQTPSPNDNI